ncbi:MAG: hypothetical protein ACOX2K_02415 [Bacillota bacterium]
MRRFKPKRLWFDVLDWVSVWAMSLIVLIEMTRLVFKPNSLDGIVLVLAVLVLLNMLK